MEKKPLVILAGPTAAGKTALSISLAKAIDGEIISCDSMQVYKYMDIGSAKIMPDEMQGIPHYMVDELLPSEEFNVCVFLNRAREAISQIYAKGKIPIAVGGTGFYIQALLKDTDFSQEATDGSVRKKLEAYAKDYGAEALFQRLKEVDPQSAEMIHPNNIKRVIRALEFYKLHGTPISAHNSEQKEKESPYNFCYFVLNDKRERLYASIDKRVDQMMSMGLLDEVKNLKEMGYSRENVSMQGLGYKELLDYLDGKYSLEEAVYTIKRDTRHFAKRQLTWFRSKPEVTWIQKDEFQYDTEKILQYMMEELHKNKVLLKG